MPFSSVSRIGNEFKHKVLSLGQIDVGHQIVHPLFYQLEAIASRRVSES